VGIQPNFALWTGHAGSHHGIAASSPVVMGNKLDTCHIYQGQQFTVEAKGMTGDCTGGWEDIVAKGCGTPLFGCHGGQWLFGRQCGPAPTLNVAATSNADYHIWVTRDGTEFNMYLNGEHKVEWTMDTTFETCNPLTVGGDSANYEIFTGGIDTVIWCAGIHEHGCEDQLHTQFELELMHGHCAAYDSYMRYGDCSSDDKCQNEALTVTTLSACKNKCDEKDGCVAVAWGVPNWGAHTGNQCVLYIGGCTDSGAGTDTWNLQYFAKIPLGGGLEVTTSTDPPKPEAPSTTSSYEWIFQGQFQLPWLDLGDGHSTAYLKARGNTFEITPNATCGGHLDNCMWKYSADQKTLAVSDASLCGGLDRYSCCLQWTAANELATLKCDDCPGNSCKWCMIESGVTVGMNLMRPDTSDDCQVQTNACTTGCRCIAGEPGGRISLKVVPSSGYQEEGSDGWDCRMRFSGGSDCSNAIC